MRFSLPFPSYEFLWKWYFGRTWSHWNVRNAWGKNAFVFLLRRGSLRIACRVSITWLFLKHDNFTSSLFIHVPTIIILTLLYIILYNINTILTFYTPLLSYCDWLFLLYTVLCLRNLINWYVSVLLNVTRVNFGILLFLPFFIPSSLHFDLKGHKDIRHICMLVQWN